MRISCQFSIYPMGVDPIGPAVNAAVGSVRAHGLEVDVGPMSSIVWGETAEVFGAVEAGFRAAASRNCVLVATFSNACPEPTR